MNLAEETHDTETNQEQRLSMYPNFDYSEIASAQLFVYFHQVRMDIMLEGISYVGVWDAYGGRLLISVSDGATRVEDGKIFSFDGPSQETQNPENIAECFEEYVRRIMLDEADNYEAPGAVFPIN